MAFARVSEVRSECAGEGPVSIARREGPRLEDGAHPSLGSRLIAWYPRVILIIACYWFADIYCTVRHPYLNLTKYAHGQERLPFQQRDLMRWPMLAASHSAFLQHVTAKRSLLHSPEFFVMELVAAISLMLAGWAAVKLYRLARPDGPLPELPFVILIIICYYDFLLGVPFSFPYDLPSTAFLGWGTYFAMKRRFWVLLPIFLLGTWNRETTLFLIGIVLIVAASRSGTLHWKNLRLLDLLQAAVLFVGWAAIEMTQRHHYRGNPTEAGPRIRSNLHYLANPQLWPHILSASAFLLPYVYFNRHRISYAPIRYSMLLLPFWVLLLLSVGQILELRIYGDISVLIAVATALLVVQGIESHRSVRHVESSSGEQAVAP